jgi:DNA-binding transcriptional MocR family regulator
LLQYKSVSDTEQYTISGRTSSDIAASVEAAVRSGALSQGERLPSIRPLARSLGVSPATVAAAYRELGRRGVVLARERSGAVVSMRPPVATERLSARIPPGVRDLASGNPDPALLPDLGAALRRISSEHALYGTEPVDGPLLELARRELEHIGVPGDHLCVVAGALDGVERAIAAHLRPGDRIAVEDPGYSNAFDLLRALGLVIVPVAVDDAGMRPDALSSTVRGGVEAVLITPRGQNPTGAALDAERAADLGDVLASAPEALVVEDDHLGRIAGVAGSTTIPGRARWAFVRSVAKSLGPDLRLAVLAGDVETVSRVQGRQQLGPGWVSHLLQRLVVELLSDPATKALLGRAEAEYAARRSELLDALASRGIEAHGKTGFNVWIPVHDETAVVQELLASGRAVMAGARYRLRSAPAVRVTASTLEPGEADDLAAAVAGALTPSRRTRAA